SGALQPPIDSGDGVRLAVCIVNYRTAEMTLGCMESFVDQLELGRDCGIVIDNASGDGSADDIEAAVESRGWSDRVRIIRSPDNGGFSAGHTTWAWLRFAPGPTSYSTATRSYAPGHSKSSIEHLWSIRTPGSSVPASKARMARCNTASSLPERR
ncbi:MAG: glycosyltransferase, partial [Planctomycetes bacterium]|nr:glycosyltransferase [Planctomycetota bacterium]